MKPNEINAKKIAELTGVSLSTVSIVLNNRSDEFRISDKTAERILETANKLGYQPVKRERRKKRNFHKSVICVFLPFNLEGSPINQFLKNTHKYMRDQGLQYKIILLPYELGKLHQVSTWICSEFASGAVLMALTDSDIEFIENSSFNIPVVLYNRTARGYCSVLTDDYTLGSKAMSHFIRRGHKKFVTISPDYSSRALSLRGVGYFDRFRSQNFDSGTDAFILPTVFSEANDMGGYNAMREILKSEALPTAVFVLADCMVTGVVRCIKEAGFDIPENFEIISYGNNTVNSIIKPGITSFAPPLQEMGCNCIKILHSAITRGTLTDSVKLSFEAECVFRESSPEA
ncbi:LacI family transcriptional regulator [Anaerobacterium chartisolvens]|uniref:LacI family transcriptional regulator n=1 Tax=Anaerobacterium chartisolvens TaxID=1297424 RepID=A0A369BD41_9FIRM|nr:LacI family DNA-binding transcriptional regulator [Anaerobacterium chartisolvens]RCX19480.1 LacI family transcriptional regulator [Anaerobacterium chartisolvens]